MAKVDLHVHCSERSGCAVTTEEEQVKAAIAAGLDGIVFTDHYKLPGLASLEALNRKYAPFKIYTGIELTADHEDWLVIGLRDEGLERQDWTYPELHGYVRARGGFLVLAHPFRFRSEIMADIRTYPPDAIEARSHNTPAAKEGEIRAIADQLGLAVVSNSDAHKAASLGPYYNELPGILDGEAGLVQALLRMKKEAG